MLAHADGKKHRGKARSFHAKQQGSENPATENASNGVSEEEKKEDSLVSSDSLVEKKRKLETLVENNNGEVVQTESEVKKAKKQEGHEKKINWKKLITSALKSVRVYLSINSLFLSLTTCNFFYLLSGD